MRIDVFHHIDYGDGIHEKLDRILRKLENIGRKEEDLMKEVDDMIAKVEETKGIDESMAVAIDSTLAYEQQILAQIANTTDPAVIKDLTDKLTAYNTALAAKRDQLLAAIPANAPTA